MPAFRPVPRERFQEGFGLVVARRRSFPAPPVHLQVPEPHRGGEGPVRVDPAGAQAEDDVVVDLCVVQPPPGPGDAGRGEMDREGSPSVPGHAREAKGRLNEELRVGQAPEPGPALGLRPEEPRRIVGGACGQALEDPEPSQEALLRLAPDLFEEGR
jgi:hypothetical protein